MAASSNENLYKADNSICQKYLVSSMWRNIGLLKKSISSVFALMVSV